MIKNKFNVNYPGWELKFFDNSKNFRNYQLELIRNFLKGHVAEVGPGNGANLSHYIKFPKKIDLYEPTKKLYIGLKKNFKKTVKFLFTIKNLYLEKNTTLFCTLMFWNILKMIRMK